MSITLPFRAGWLSTKRRFLYTLVALSTLVSPRAWADSWASQEQQRPSGFIITALAGAQASYLWSYDDMNVMVSPSRYEAHDAEALCAGSQFGFDLGYGFDGDWRLIADFRLAYLESKDTHDAGISLILERRVVSNLALRLGLGYRYYEAQAEVTAETVAGPGRTAESDWARSLQGTAITGQIGVLYQLPLADWFAVTASFDTVMSIVELEDADETRFDDSLFGGFQLGIGTRLYL